MTAAERLLICIERLSQERYSAGWAYDCEHVFWSDVLELNHDVESSLLFHRIRCCAALAEIGLLALECDGWYRWAKGLGPVFVSLSEWRDLHDAWVLRSVDSQSRG